MSGTSQMSGSFAVADYVVFALMLVVSTAVGVYFAWASRGRENSRDFLTGGRRLTALPVSMSLTASFMSSTTLLSNPPEVYLYGVVFANIALAYVLSIVTVSELFLPVFYRLGNTSTYEYLEMRFSRATRLLGTVLFIVQTILCTGIIIYGPALALSQVTDMDLWGGIVSTGIVCTFYCTLGGLKAVVWTDVIQIGIMLAGYLSVIIRAVNLQGGVVTIISDSQRGGRLNFIDFDFNPHRRHTFWTLVVGGTFGWINIYGTSQVQVQRYVSCKSITHARVALYINMVGLCSFLTCSVFAGMSLYSVYKNCDPWKAGLISAPDQLMPYLVMDTIASYPGLPGLFFAAVCSGSLSSVSSSINALAAVTLEDLIKPYTNMSEKHLTWMSRGLTFLYGIICISMGGLASIMGGMMQAGVVLSGAIGGPLLGLFILGIFCPFTNSKGGLSGLLSGLVASFCLTIGSLIYPPPPSMTRPLSLITDGCNFTNWTSTALPTEQAPPLQPHCRTMMNSKHLLAGNWHSPSYLYFSVTGTLIAVIVGLVVSLLTGGLKTRVESRLTLMKEDTTVYHLFIFFKDRVMKRAEKFDLSKNEERKVGNINPAFRETEIDNTSNIPK